jgi:DNA-binding NtrC family response regulator
MEALIVDDDVRARELLSEFCRGQGFEVATAHDGRAAIAAIHRYPEQFAVIVTDLHLPGADGFEVLKAARDANPSVYVVMITGYASIDSASAPFARVPTDYLAKPFALGQLEVALTRIRDRMALEQENRELTKLVGGRDAAAMPDLGWRPQAIEESLAHIEALLRTRAQRLKVNGVVAQLPLPHAPRSRRRRVAPCWCSHGGGTKRS